MFIAISGERYEVNYLADTCPHCGFAVDPLFLIASLSSPPESQGVKLDATYCCPRGDCKRLFIATYRRINDHNGRAAGKFLFVRLFPTTRSLPEIAREIVEISPQFKEIYHQAYIAEKEGLSEICGVGYRKALEFLVKDYCIQQEPDNKEIIINKMLGKVIRDHVSDPKLKLCASRAVWLGNDETHYARRWGDKDIQDLIILIRLTTAWITTSVLTEEYLVDMPETKN